MEECGALLRALDGDVVRVERATPGLTSAGAEGAVDATATLASMEPPFPVVDVAAHFDGADAWARSGAMALTGAIDGPPLPCPSATLAARLVAAGSVIRLLAANTFGSVLSLDSLALLGERAALTGHTRRGSVAVGGACEVLQAADGWIALNLARADDVALLGVDLAGEDLHEGGFAGAVGAGEAIASAGGEGDGDILKEELGAVTHGDIGD